MTPPTPDTNRPNKHIILIGMMGSGKSAVAKELAHQIGWPCIDTDTAIEQQQGKSISQIFEEHGEPYFRALETQLLRQLSHGSISPHIIATGGGIVITPEHLPLIRELGFVVWLTAPPEVLYIRVAKNTTRPLLNTPDPRATLSTILEERAPLYRATRHLKISTTNLSANEIASGIKESAVVFFSRAFYSEQEC